MLGLIGSEAPCSHTRESFWFQIQFPSQYDETTCSAIASLAITTSLTMSNFQRVSPALAPPKTSILQTLQATEMVESKPRLPAGKAFCFSPFLKLRSVPDQETEDGS